MSVDDGWILRQRDDEKYVLQHYIASADEYPDINSTSSLLFDTVEEAVRTFAEMDIEYPSEYGLSVRIQVKKDVVT